MTKPYSIFLMPLVLLLACVACGYATPVPTETLPPALQPATVATTPSTHQPEVSPVASPTVAEPGRGATPRVSAPAALRVLYIREGNLWSWTEASGKAQLTSTGDMSTARLSNDGQLLAFMRGSEVWTVRMDGTGARLLVTQVDEGGALWFAPDGSLLAVSTKDHIDVVELGTFVSTTVVTYSTLGHAYYPEVVWSPDSFGFKTVIPPQTESGQAELQFVFTDGTQASLAKFMLVPLNESLPFLSPDGGYLIYAAKVSDGKKSLYLMDSSGATRPYGDPADRVRAYGWLPDSEHFVYSQEKPARSFLGNVARPPSELALENYQTIRWVDAEHYLAMQDGHLYLGDMNSGKTLIDTGATDFDFEN